MYNIEEMVARVSQMHKKFGIHPIMPAPLTPEEVKFRCGALIEEAEEFLNSTTEEEDFDALLDLTVFNIGTADRMGRSDLFLDFMAAHMRDLKDNINLDVDSGHVLLSAVQETCEAIEDQDDPESVCRALAFLQFQILGLAKNIGYEQIWAIGFKRVMDANCYKELGPNSNKKGGRGEFKIDLVKPADWTAPDHSDLVAFQNDLGIYIPETLLTEQ